MASATLHQEVLPILAQAASALIRKVSRSLDSEAVNKKENETVDSEDRSPEVSKTSSTDAVFRECVQLLERYPDLVAPAPIFTCSRHDHWRHLPVMTLASFAENKIFLRDPMLGPESSLFLSSEKRRWYSTHVFARRTLGTYAAHLFLNPSSLARVSFQHQSRGFKSRSTSTGIGRSRTSESAGSSTLDELKAKFDSRGLNFKGVRASGGAQSDKQSFSQVLRQHEQSPDIQGHLKVAFADGYATADNQFVTSNVKPVQRVIRILWTVVTLLIIIQLLSFLWNGLSGVAGGVTMSMNMNKHEVKPEEVNVTFKDVKGVDEAKEELIEIVEFLKDPERFSALGGRMPRGVLLVGKPGIGKTLLARAVAGEAGVPFFHASGSEFDEIFVGTGAKRVRQLFAAAKAKAPCVLFIDEIDTCGAKRTSSQLHPYANQTINQLLAEMDGFNKSEGVVVLGATNKRENLDPALLRPGRFDVEVQVWPPDLKGRTELFDHYLSKIKADSVEVNAENLAKKTVGFLGAQIANVVNQAAIKAARDNAALVSMIDLEWALDKERMGPEKKNRIDDDLSVKRTASHEAGHTIVNYFTQHSDPINKVTIVPRGQTLGRLDQMQDREYDTTRGRLLARIDVCMGGRVGEEMALGEENVATGATSDFETATLIASQIVRLFGMSDAAGTRTYHEARLLSESMKELVDLEIKKLLDEGYKRAKSILEQHKTEHNNLVDALLLYETLDSDDIKAVIEGREPPTAAKKMAEKSISLTGDSKDIITKGLRASNAPTTVILPVPPTTGDKPRTPSGQ